MASNGPGAVVIPLPSTNSAAVDIRGVKGAVEIPTGWEWLWWTLGAIAFALVARWIWRKYQLRRIKPKVHVVIPPHRRAKDKLRTALDLLSEPYAFCSLVSDVIRLYIEERFEYHAPDRTTEEFLAEVQNGERLTGAQQHLLADFLTRCDLVKFARYEPTEPELRALYDSALRFVDETAEVGDQSTGSSKGVAAAP